MKYVLGYALLCVVMGSFCLAVADFVNRYERLTSNPVFISLFDALRTLSPLSCGLLLFSSILLLATDAKERLWMEGGGEVRRWVEMVREGDEVGVTEGMFACASGRLGVLWR